MKSTGIPWLVLSCLAVLPADPGIGGEPKVLDPGEVAREFTQRSWQHEHGLPAGDRIYAILQARDGYLWLGTQQGLARFDGRVFTVFDHVNTPELLNDECRTLAEDLNGNLWIGTGAGLIRKSGNQFQSFARKLGNRHQGYPPLAASRSGGVWVGGLTAVCYVHGDVVRVYPQEAAGPPGPSLVTCLEETEPGFVWVGTKTGFGRLDAKTGRFENFSRQSPFEGFYTFSMQRATNGGLWIQFLEYESAPDRWNPLSSLAWMEPGKPLQSPFGKERWLAKGAFVLPCREGGLWLPGSSAGEIRRWRKEQMDLMPILRRDDKDLSLSAFADREGNLWIGTEASGLQCWTPRKASSFTTRDGLAHENTWSICEARDGSVWVGTDGGVTRIKNGKTTTLKAADGSIHKEVRAVAEDLDGSIWIGTMRTLECYRDGVSRPVELPGEWFEEKIRVLLAARDGAMWIGSVRGLTRFHKGQRTKYTKADGLGSDEVRAILEDRSGDLWVGTLGGGLSRIHQGQFTTISTTNGLISNNVWALHEDSDQIIWIGTDNGISLLREGKITSITKAHGLPDPLVNSIVSDDEGHLWIGHDRGIYALHRAQILELTRGLRTNVAAVEYGEADGLPSAETNGQKSNPAACKTRDGLIWFPTTRGLAVIDPAKVGTYEVPPLSVIEEVRANGKQVLGNTPEARALPDTSSTLRERGLDLDLPAGGARVLEFHYTANTFIAPDQTRFKYRLVGLDNNWIDAGTRRQAYFTNLRPGDYRFELLARNHQGMWQEQSAAIAFHVAPFYYQTWWFYTGCAAMTAVLAALIIGWRARESRRIYELERINALNEQRRRIARDIHDELGSSLTHIMRLSDQARTTRERPGTPDTQSERIASIASEAVDNIGEIVWANNPEYDTLEDLVAYLREHAASYFADSDTKVRFDFPEAVSDRPVTGLFRRHVVMVLKEALQNVSKHAGAQSVRLRLAAEKETLELDIADDGRGLPKSGTRRFGNGLTNMRQRVEELKGTFRIDSEPGKGTEIRVVIPLRDP